MSDDFAPMRSMIGLLLSAIRPVIPVIVAVLTVIAMVL